MRPQLACLLLLSSCVGCQQMMADRDGRAVGDDLGFFDVSAELAENTCGDGAMGAEPEWDFTVQLRKDPPYLYWVNGAELIQGRLEPDGSFDVVSEGLHDLTGEPGITQECMIVRTDRAAGLLEEHSDEGSDAVSSFEGSLSYSYVPTVESDCAALASLEGGFEQLPCAIRYHMTGTPSSEGNAQP